jgi:CheY-like chemotaxis protein
MIVKVLIADDSEADRFFLKRAMLPTSSLKLVGEVDGGDLLQAYILGEGEFADREKHPFPDLLIADASMPLLHADEFLPWLKQLNHAKLTIAILTGSSLSDDCERFLRIGADACFVKNADPPVLRYYLKQIEENILRGDFPRNQRSHA